MRPHGPWKIKESRQVYQDPYVTLDVDQVIRPDGADGQHVVVHMKPGVCVFAVDEQRQVHLTSEFHYGIGQISLEGVSGGIEPGEDPDVTAARELQEELGLEAERWEFLTSVDPFTTIVVSPTRLYLAQDLREVPSSQEGTERIERVSLSLEEACQKVFDGEISHAPTCVGLLMLDRML